MRSKYSFFAIFVLLLCWFGHLACQSAPTQNEPAIEVKNEATSETNQQDAGNAEKSTPDVSTSEATPEPAQETPQETATDKSKQENPFPEIYGSRVLKDENPDPKIVEVRLTAYPSRVQLSPEIAQIMYTYNGIIPGPIIRARVGDKVIVHFTNKLSEPTTVHWHGLRISDQMDGSPRIQKPVEANGTFTYSFEVKEAGTFWYHPHVRSNEQVEKGLYGMLIVQEKENIAFDRERSVILDDILLINNRLAEFLKSHPEVMHGRNGNYLFANGKLEPKTVEVPAGSVERWRLVNVANARTMTLQLKGLKARVIGTDGGLIPKPLDFTDRLTITVGQRFDLEVIFEKPGDYSLDMLTQDSSGQLSAYPMLKVKVTGEAPKTVPTPPSYPTIEPLPSKKAEREVEITFDGVQDPSMPGGVAWRLNKNARWDKPMMTFKQGEVVDLKLKNLNAQPHPFHLHGQFFTVISRNGGAAQEPGLKDTVLLQGNETLVIRAYFDNPGRWMAHCHILEHAELGMMAEVVVTPTP